MRERASLIGGTFEIESAPGSGTAVLIRVPITPAHKRRSPALSAIDVTAEECSGK